MRIVIAGGGTGGHLFPGVAVAEEVARREPDSVITFVGTARGIEARVVPELGYPLELIEVRGIKTVGVGGAVRGLLSVPGALWQSRRILRRARPEVVLGVGGYASGPVVLMARMMGIPTAILEQNSIPGMTNKMLGKVVRRVFAAFSESARFFPERKLALVGNPIRADIRAALTGSPAAATGAEGPTDADAASNAAHGPTDAGAAAAAADTNAATAQTAPSSRSAGAPRLFVFGGSQGAVAVNQLAADAAALLAKRDIALDIVHQTGAADLEATEARYAAAGVDAACHAFIADMASEYRRADLIVSRAGATTIAELGVAGRAAILIPYPFAADDHQEHNAREMVDAGAALCFRQSELSAATLADAIAELAVDDDRRTKMSEAMRALGRPDAAAAVVDWCHAQRRG